MTTNLKGKPQKSDIHQLDKIKLQNIYSLFNHSTYL